MKYVVLEEESRVSKEANATWGTEEDKLREQKSNAFFMQFYSWVPFKKNLIKVKYTHVRRVHIASV